MNRLKEQLRNNVLEQLDGLMAYMDYPESTEEGIQRELGILHHLYKKLINYQKGEE